MKPRIRNIQNLYHRWGRRVGLEAGEVANVLLRCGLIELIGLDQYREVVSERVPTKAFDEMVLWRLKEAKK